MKAANNSNIKHLNLRSDNEAARGLMRPMILGVSILLLFIASSEICVSAENAKLQEVTVFNGEEGWRHNGIDYRLACGVNLQQMPSGDLLVTWLSGTDSEPAVDNCILASRSTDGGWTWSEPWIMVAADKEAGGLTSLFIGDDGQLVAFGANWPAEDEYTKWFYFRMESRDGGRTWSKRERFTVFGDRACIAHRIKLDNGQWLFPASIFIKRDKGLHGSSEEIAGLQTESEAQALAARHADPNPDKFARVTHGCMAFLTDDASATTLMEGGSVTNRPAGLIEPTVVQLNDGTVVMLMRAQMGGFLWESRSYDRGKTWTPAVATDIPNPSSLAFVMRLRDGRIALFNNPTGGKVGKHGPRDPLAMWISDDEMKTWSVKQDIASGGRCAYPMAVETKDGSLLVAYDRDRRQIRIVHVSFGATPARDVGAKVSRDAAFARH